MTTRRGFFRAVLALPFAPKCIQAFRPKTRAQRIAGIAAMASDEDRHRAYLEFAARERATVGVDFGREERTVIVEMRVRRGKMRITRERYR